MNQNTNAMGETQETTGSGARRAALRMMDAVLRRGETLDNAAHAACQGLKSREDKALARALAGEGLRWMGDLDALIDSATNQILPDDAKPRAVLRLMLAGWLRLGTPPHAVVATGLDLLQGGPRRLAHGVFSTLVKRAVTLPDAPTLPEKVAARWGERGAGIAAGLAVPPPLDLTMRDYAETAMWAEKLGGVSLMPGHVRLARGSAVEKLEGYDTGAWWVQDLAATIPARLIGPGTGRALDLCAAPGGKTMQLAAQGWDVTALDLSPKRLGVVRDNLKRTGLSAECVAGDALTWEPEGGFDAILIDAPCTATGTARRHPDVLHRITARQIADMADIQQRMIERATGWLNPGGRLVYAVCSLEREEGRDQAAQVVGLESVPVLAGELPAGVEPTSEGWVKTDPGMLLEAGGLDGFFVARWVKG
jgi:16S rRNA (cytosine967-C5)-methyltransferase